MQNLFAEPKPERTKAQLDFINERTRWYMVKWCDYFMVTGERPEDDGKRKRLVYWESAMQKGWISKKGDKILSAGWKTAAAFLRR